MLADYSRDLRPAKWGPTVNLHSNNSEPLMSALGQKQTSRLVRTMSALPPKADMDQYGRDVCLVPKADMSDLEVGWLLVASYSGSPAFRRPSLKRSVDALFDDA